MSAHDYVLDNDTGQNFRLDLNNALAAIVSNNSGATAPSTTYAYQWWVDTSGSPKVLKIRNAANSAWITIGTVEASNFGLLPLAGGTMTGAFLAAALLSLSTCDVAFTGDANSGLSWISADTFALVVGGAEILRVKADPEFKNSTAVKLPTGGTAARPGSPAAGQVRFNSDTNQFEGYANSVWSQLGASGGGAGFEWKEVSGTAPVPTEENGEIPYLFGAALAQELYTTIKVPQSYSGGTQITLYGTGYSPSSANTILFRAQSTLIRKNTDAFTSTTNQRTSTNAALTNTVANMVREFAFDITDSTGKINSVSVAAGDMIKVRLYRDTDSDTADLRLLPNATDIKYA